MRVNSRIEIADWELIETYLAASGPGGQNVNKVAAAVQMRFDARNSPNLPEDVRQRFLARYNSRLTKDGVLVITADRYRHRERNREDARERLSAMILAVAEAPKKRRPTRPTRGSKERRIKAKTQRGQVKKLRGKPASDD